MAHSRNLMNISSLCLWAADRLVTGTEDKSKWKRRLLGPRLSEREQLPEQASQIRWQLLCRSVLFLRPLRTQVLVCKASDSESPTTRPGSLGRVTSDPQRGWAFSQFWVQRWGEKKETAPRCRGGISSPCASSFLVGVFFGLQGKREKRTFQPFVRILLSPLPCSVTNHWIQVLRMNLSKACYWTDFQFKHPIPGPSGGQRLWTLMQVSWAPLYCPTPPETREDTLDEDVESSHRRSRPSKKTRPGQGCVRQRMAGVDVNGAQSERCGIPGRVASHWEPAEVTAQGVGTRTEGPRGGSAPCQLVWLGGPGVIFYHLSTVES